MTTIAVNKQSIACDLQGTYNGSTSFKMETKIVAVPAPVAEKMFNVKQCFVGFAGNIDAWGQTVSWFYDDPFSNAAPKCKGTEFIMLTDRGKILHSLNLKYWMEIKEPHFAIGSGYSYALAAMSAGKTPKEAIHIASKYDLGTGLGVKAYEFS